MEDREKEIREYFAHGKWHIAEGGGFSFEDVSYLLSIIDSLRASQKELIEAGEFIINHWALPSGYRGHPAIRRLKEAIERAKEE